MQKLVRVSEQNLAEILLKTQALKGMNFFASVVQVTRPKCTVKSRTNKEIKNPYKDVVKISKVGILLNSDYQTAVTNQLVREGKEKSEYDKGVNTMPLEYGENNQFIGKYKDEYVLQYRTNDNVLPKSKYVADKSKLVDFLPLSNNASNQGTDRAILWRKLYLKNVQKITLDGVTYKVTR
jgi:hypothetical protein